MSVAGRVRFDRVAVGSYIFAFGSALYGTCRPEVLLKVAPRLAYSFLRNSLVSPSSSDLFSARAPICIYCARQWWSFGAAEYVSVWLNRPSGNSAFGYIVDHDLDNFGRGYKIMLLDHSRIHKFTCCDLIRLGPIEQLALVD